MATFEILTGSNVIGGGGGSSSYLVSSVTLTDAQIKTIPTVGYQILPSPGANKYYKLLGSSVVTDTSAGAYTFVGDSWLFLTTDDADWPLLSTFAQWSGGGAGQFIDNIPVPYISASGSDIISNAQPFNKFSDIIDKPILLRDWNISSNYTGGNAANTLKVKVYYVVVDL